MATAVLIVNYHSYDELGRCLASVAPRLRQDDEVAVVDYESDAAALARAAAALPRTVLLPRPDNRGFAAGVNLAAAGTRAPFLLLLNPDATAEGPLIETLEGFLESHADAAVAGPRILDADGSLQQSARRFPDFTTWLGGRSSWLTGRLPGNWMSQRNLLARAGGGPIDVDWVSGACLMTRRDLFERLGGFDEGFFLYWEDADYCRRVAQAGFRRVYVPDVTVRHVAGRSSARNPIPSIRAFHQSAYRLYQKSASPLGRLASPAIRAGLRLREEWLVRRAREGAPSP